MKKCRLHLVKMEEFDSKQILFFVIHFEFSYNNVHFQQYFLLTILD